MAGGHGGSSKIWTILKWILLAFIVALIIFWIITGGPRKAWEVGKHYSNPAAIIFNDATSSDGLIRLPWQPTELTRGPDITGYAELAEEQRTGADGGSTSRDEIRQFGEPSPYAGVVVISGSSIGRGQEYIELASQGSVALGISGWSLQSAASGLRAYIGNAAPVFISGVVNQTAPVFFGIGEHAIVTTGASPVGVSFRENVCTGYLQRFQEFTPPLTTPSAAGASYNECVNAHYADASFALPSWRIYLSASSPLWNPTHDTIRLLDGSGRIVDVISY